VTAPGFGACERLVRTRLVHAHCGTFASVIDEKLFEDFRKRIDEALRNSPAQDIEKNLRAMLGAWFERMDLVLREDFEVQKKLLERAQAKLAELERRIAELEALKPPSK
jgi:BMFP domain-containing protein YqiC